MIAACEEPNPGNKPVKLPEKTAAEIAFILFFVFIVSDIICFGIFILLFKDKIKVLIPNKPDSKGKMGWFKLGMFKVNKPKIPESKNM